MSENDVVIWSKGICLKWSDFKAESNPAIFEDSHSSIKYRFTWTIDSDKQNDDIVFSIDKINVTVEFNPLLSWVRESESNDTLLIHEQGHFDLAEMIRRDYDIILKTIFYEKFFPTRGQNDAQRKQFAKEDSGKMISIEIDKLDKILKQKRKDYDEETEFGKHIQNQNKFNDDFKKLKNDC
jgi:hypothetical protein